MRQIEKDLKEIGESTETLLQLRELMYEWGKKKGLYIQINRIPKKGWLIYGLKEKTQLFQWCGLGVLEEYFDSPITSLNRFLKELNKLIELTEKNNVL